MSERRNQHVPAGTDVQGGRAAADTRYTFHDHAPAPDNFREAVLHGLSQPDKSIPFRFLYDATGSRLFEQICRQPEYYITRTELALLEDHAADIARRVGPGAQLVELGSGAGIKVQRLLQALPQPAAYIAVEISRPALVAAVQRLAADWPQLAIHAVWADFASRFSLPLDKAGPVVGFFPGSSIGNLRPEQAQHLLGQWRQRLGAGAHLVIGADLVKPSALLEAAYNDAAGVTAAFTGNLLVRINRELGADFDLDGFEHEARYLPGRTAIQINLVSRRQQQVSVAGRCFDFQAGERLHVEDSHKYSIEAFRSLAAAAGWQAVDVWTDADGLFSVHHLRVPG